MISAKLKDERRFFRRMIHAEVKCQRGSKSWTAYLTDVSVGGIFVESDEVLTLGEKIQFDFVLPFPEKRMSVRFQITGEVVRLHSPKEDFLSAHGFCAQFLDVSEKENICLRAYTRVLVPLALGK